MCTVYAVLYMHLLCSFSRIHSTTPTHPCTLPYTSIIHTCAPPHALPLKLHHTYPHTLNNTQVGVMRTARYVKGKKVGKGPLVQVVCGVGACVGVERLSLDSILRDYILRDYAFGKRMLYM